MRRNRAFDVVTAFEEELCDYTGAPYCVTTDSCTNALYLCFRWKISACPTWPRTPLKLHLPKQTYVGVAQAAINAGFSLGWRDEAWVGSYRILGDIIDSAKRLYHGMYEYGTLTCLSFQAGKILPIGRGGAILTDNKDAADWLRRARLDGRTAGADYADNTYQQFGAHCYMTPPDAARGLWLLTYADDDNKCDWTEYPDLSEATWT